MNLLMFLVLPRRRRLELSPCKELFSALGVASPVGLSCCVLKARLWTSLAQIATSQVEESLQIVLTESETYEAEI